MDRLCVYIYYIRWHLKKLRIVYRFEEVQAAVTAGRGEDEPDLTSAGRVKMNQPLTSAGRGEDEPSFDSCLDSEVSWTARYSGQLMSKAG